MSTNAMFTNTDINVSTSKYNWANGKDNNQKLKLPQTTQTTSQQTCQYLLNLKRNNAPGIFITLLFLALSILLLTVEKVDACQISEYYCDNRKCVSLDKFCNGVDDCGDSSDEPRHCSRKF